jgi:hypothetical protein
MRYKFYFLDFFEFFDLKWSKKRSNLYLNDQIHIQTIKFKFKWINQELSTHYHRPVRVAGGSASGTAWALPAGPAPVWAGGSA